MPSSARSTSRSAGASFRDRPRRALAWLALLAALLVVDGVARADAPGPFVDEAQLHFEAGSRALAGGDAATAIREFEAAQALRPSPVLGYYLAAAHDQAGRACVALPLYRRYTVEVPNAANRGDVEARIVRLLPYCEPPPALVGAVAPAPAVVVAPPPAVAVAPIVTVAPTPAPRVIPVAPRAPPSRRRNAWKAWVAVGVVATVATVVVVVVLAAVYLPSSKGGSSHHDWDLRTGGDAPPDYALIRF